MRTHFGRRASYLIDFYHLCDYFAEAAERAPIQNKSACLGRLKAAAKKGQMKTILRWFQKWEEPASVPKEEAPIRALMRYVNNRPGQFDYPNAIKNGLPIGSGQIESSHRHLIQKRLKISGLGGKNRMPIPCCNSESQEKTRNGRTTGNSSVLLKSGKSPTFVCTRRSLAVSLRQVCFMPFAHFLQLGCQLLMQG